MTEQSTAFTEVEDEDGQIVEVYDGEPEAVDRDMGGAQDMVEADEAGESA